MRIASSRRALVAALSLAALAATTTALPASATKPGGPTSGTGTVFSINPVQSTGNQNLTDNKDADAPAFAPAYKRVTLTDLDGTGYLDGEWANVRQHDRQPGLLRRPAVYNYNRSDDRFEQVMAYYWVTAAQKYIQSLGFGTGAARRSTRSRRTSASTSGGRTTPSRWDKNDVIRLGKGGVDDGEDAEVIMHEYGHAVHDAQVPGFGTSLEAGAIGEAFGDYLAVTVGQRSRARRRPASPAACVADWDSVSYDADACRTACAGSTSTSSSRTVANQVHFDGQIWSRALWDIRNALGARDGRPDHHQRAVRLRAGHVLRRRGGRDGRDGAGDVRRRGGEPRCARHSRTAASRSRARRQVVNGRGPAPHRCRTLVVRLCPWRCSMSVTRMPACAL